LIAAEDDAALSGAATTISLNDLPEEVRGGSASGITPVFLRPAVDGSQPIPEEGVNFDAVVTEVERQLLLQSLNKSGGNKMRAAKLLNMKRTTFVEKLKRLQIDGEASEELPEDP
jgi:DNA-binding NtrC family response regulator